MIEGCVSLISGMRRLLAEASLRAVLWRIVLLLLVLMLGVIFGSYELAEYLAGLWVPSGDAWYWQLLAWLGWFLSVSLAFFTGAVSFTVLGTVAAAPWLDTLAERAEVLHSGKALAVPEQSMLYVVMQSLGNAIRPLGGLLLMGVLALAVIWIPVIGQMAAMLIWGYAGIRFLNFELLDVAASRRGWTFAQRKTAFTKRRFFWLGFGGSAMAMILVPVLNLLVLPAAVVALSSVLPADEKTIS